MKVTIKEEKCMGCGSCPSLVPDVFDFNDDGFAYCKVDTVPEDLEDGVKEAIDMCPTGAIVEEKSE